jgi:phosphate transport system permease protein
MSSFVKYLKKTIKIREFWTKLILGFFALSSIIFLLGILFTLLSQSIPFFSQYNIFDFFTDRYWRPTFEPPSFGILPLIAASLEVTIGALIVSVPLSLGSAIFLSEVAPNWLRETLKPIIEILAGIPSVVFGFIGMVIIAPIIKDLFNLPIGLCGLNGAFILGFMAFPTISSLAEDAISSVPKDVKEASLALGANKWETVTKVTIPYAKSGIYSAIILGFARVIGETMTVLMVVGGAPNLTYNIFKPLRPITATIAAEMGEAPFGGLHYHSLFTLAFILFLITLGFNLLAERLKGIDRR